MKTFTLMILLITSGAALGFDALPGSPLDTDMGNAAGNVGGTVNQLTPMREYEKNRSEEEEQQREEELLENRYDVPDEEEEREFNLNGTKNP